MFHQLNRYNGAGTMEAEYPETDEPFDYERLYQECEKREPVGEMTSLDTAAAANPYADWNYPIPVSPKDNETEKTACTYAGAYDYYLSRGCAVVVASGIGTYGSEGLELCGTDLERDSHKAVVEWLAGNRRAFTDRYNRVEIRADWSNGKVAMTGVSYGGTMPYEVATIFDVNYADSLASFNCGACYLDQQWRVMNKDYVAWLNQIARDQEETNGNYAPIWAESDYSDDWENIRCSALVVQGMNDFNVTTKQADLMVQAFQKAGANVKLALHQNGHQNLDNMIVNDEVWNETINRWLAHYLYDVDNGAENMPAVLVQSNVDGSWKAYDSWRDFNYIDAPVSYEDTSSVVKSKGLAAFFTEYSGTEAGADSDNLSQEERDHFYMSLTDDHLAAYYPIELPENTTVYGVPEIHLKLSSEITEYEGLMITAVLVDTADDGSAFEAFMTKDRLSQTLTTKVIGEYEGSASWGSNSIVEFVPDLTKERSCYSDGKRILKFLIGTLVNPFHRGRRIVDQEIDLPMFFCHTLCKTFQNCLIRNISDIMISRTDIDHLNMTSFISECLCSRQADSVPAAGYDRSFAGKYAPVDFSHNTAGKAAQP